MIYTLDWLENEAKGIAGHWDGSAEHYTDASGDLRTDEEAQAASELLTKIKEVHELIKELSL